ncbi:uncharacterized protein A4U43_UnF11270 [Asparagus officinalis]|uniref:Uncharacterized protein n=2 Tax=Asparagus officinalis TaxID=4686 RepID=A0A1R3L5A1_ASPOF|nr:uncharacterized protein A4U43_UnF11270 [Asparagus officinalis]
MVYPSFGEDQGAAAAYLLENRVDDQDTHIAQLEEENLTLKERLFLVEREVGDLRRRLQILEAGFRGRGGGGVSNNNDDENNPNVDDNEGSYSGNHNNNNNNNNVNLNLSLNLNEEGDVCSENGDESNEARTPMREERGI